MTDIRDAHASESAGRPGELPLGPLTLLAREIPHEGGRTFGYRVSDGRSAIAYVPDHSPTDLAGARAVLMLHHRPDRTDAELDKRAAALAGAGPVPVTLGADGDVIAL